MSKFEKINPDSNQEPYIFNLDQLLEATRAIPWEADGETLQFTYVGPQAANILGYPVEKWYEKDFWVECIHPEDRERVVNFCLSSSNITDNYDFEYRMIAADGQVIWFQDIVNVHRVNGKINSIRGFLLDITERRKVQDFLQVNQSFRASLKNSLAGSVYHVKFSENSLSECVCEGVLPVCGCPSTVDSSKLANWGELIHPADRGYAIEEMKRQIAEKNQFDIEYRTCTTTGEQKWIWDRGIGIFSDTGELSAIEGFATDITKNKLAEEAITKSEKEFRAIFELSAVSNTVVDVNSGRFIRVNKAFCNLTGYTEDELLQLTYPEITPLGVRDKDQEGFENFIHSDRDTWLVEKKYQHKDGQDIWVVVNGKILRDENNQPVQAIATIIDVTARKLAEEEFLRNQQLLQQAQRIANLGNWDWKLESNEFLATEHMCRMYGLDPEQAPFTVQHFIDRIHPEDQIIVEDVINEALTDHLALHEFEYRVPGEDGTERLVSIYALTEFDVAERRPIRFFGTAHDITEQRQLEEKISKLRLELEHHGRLACMGEFAASIAHELNQPLTGIHSNAHTALRYLDSEKFDHEEMKNALTDIADDSKRSGDIIRQLRGITMNQLPVMEQLDLNNLLDKVILLVNSEAILHRIDVSVTYAENLGRITACKVELQHVLMNLIRNAFDAALNNGQKLKTVSIDISIPYINIVKVTVRDNGPFVSEEVIDSLFDPFFSTKENGMGMGLSICQEIIKQHEGKIWAKANEDGAGLAVSFILPIQSAAESKGF